jgi:hypothetical protein
LAAALRAGLAHGRPISDRIALARAAQAAPVRGDRQGKAAVTLLCRLYDKARAFVSISYAASSTFRPKEGAVMTAIPKSNAFAKSLNVGRAPRAAALRLIVENRKAAKVSRKFPRRPNLHVLNDAIPLFYICQNRQGFWIARDAEGRTGGLFLRKQSALRFAQRQSATGCAIMQLNEPSELDLANQGNRIAKPLGVIIDLAERRAPLLVAFAGTMLAEWRKLMAEISSVLASGRKHRAAAERELFHGEARLCSKGDDDLPVV